MKILDIRQSEQWAQYLAFLGWQSIRTSTGINIELIPFGLGKIAKVQRPWELNPTDLQEIAQVCKNNKALFVKLEPNLEQNMEVLTANGYIMPAVPLTPPSTIFIELQKPQETLWNAISRSGKYSIRRAQREKATVEIYQNPAEEQLRHFHNILTATGKLKGFHVQPFADLQKKVELFRDEAYLLVAKTSKGETAGANFYLGFNKNIWFIHGGTTEVGRKGKEGYQLVWQSFDFFKKRGYEILDLEGKDDPRYPNFTGTWGGFAHFKEKFGGVSVQYPAPKARVFNPLLKKVLQFNKMAI